MLNAIWLGMIGLSVIVGFFQGKIDDVIQAVTTSAKFSFELALGLTGILALWLGIMQIASSSGLIERIAKYLSPIIQPLFPEIPKDDPAMGAMLMNIAANMLGLGNAATPFGLKAMHALQRLNPYAGEASDAMCTFLAINTSSVQLIPTTAIAFLAANGASQPNSIVITSLLASLVSTGVAILAVKKLANFSVFRIRGSNL